MNRAVTGVMAFAVLAAVAQATPIAPGGSEFLPAGSAPTFGTLIAGPLVSPFIAPPLPVPFAFSGTLTSNAYIGDPANPYPGGVTFTYQVSNDAASLNALGQLSNSGFLGWSTDVTWLLGTGVTAPFNQSRDGGGNVVSHSFGNFFGHTPINPGTDSVILVVHTNAPLAGVSFSSIIDGFTATVPSLAPLPTPGAGALLGIGLLAVNRRRRV